MRLLAALGLGVGVLAACTASHLNPRSWLAYHTLTVAWALTGVGVLVGGWLTSRRRLVGDVLAAPILAWVAALGVALVGLALRAAADDPLAPWWSAALILAAGALAAGAALWQRHEGWAFAAALAVSLAVSLVLWHGHQRDLLADWWVPLVQANTIAAAAAALQSGRWSRE